MHRVHRNTLFVGQLRTPWTQKPLSGLLRTLSRSQKVLRRPVRGFPCTGAQKRSPIVEGRPSCARQSLAGTLSAYKKTKGRRGAKGGKP